MLSSFVRSFVCGSSSSLHKNLLLQLRCKSTTHMALRTPEEVIQQLVEGKELPRSTLVQTISRLLMEREFGEKFVAKEREEREKEVAKLVAKGKEEREMLVAKEREEREKEVAKEREEREMLVAKEREEREKEVAKEKEERQREVKGLNTQLMSAKGHLTGRFLIEHSEKQFDWIVSIKSARGRAEKWEKILAADAGQPFLHELQKRKSLKNKSIGELSSAIASTYVELSHFIHHPHAPVLYVYNQMRSEHQDVLISLSEQALLHWQHVDGDYAPSATATPSTGGTTAPSTGSTTAPSTGGTTAQSTGGTTAPSTGGTI